MKTRDQILLIALLFAVITIGSIIIMHKPSENQQKVLATAPIPVVPPPPSALEMSPAWIETTEGVYEKNPACADMSCDGSLFRRLDGGTFRQAALSSTDAEDAKQITATITKSRVYVYSSPLVGSVIGETYGGVVWVVADVTKMDDGSYWGKINEAAWIRLWDESSEDGQPTDWTPDANAP